MPHKHHALQHAAGFIVGVILLGGTLGAVTGFLGREAVESVSALRLDRIGRMVAARAERLEERSAMRRLRRETRLQRNERIVSDIGVTYPMQTNTLQRHALSRQWEVALDAGSLSYPRLGIHAPIAKPSITHWRNRDWRALEDQMQFGLLHGLVAYPHSPAPGEEGNIIIAGHSSPPTLEAMQSTYRDIFAELPRARIGDLVSVRDGGGTPFTYRVTDSREISAAETSILLPEEGKKLKLFTCYPIGTTQNRWLVELEGVENDVRAAADST